MILRYYTFINLCAKLNIYFISANFFGKKLHFFTKKLALYHIFTLISLTFPANQPNNCSISFWGRMQSIAFPSGV